MRVAWLALWVNVFLGILKIGAGLVGHSRALVADGVHSLSDLASDVAIILGLRYAAQPKDANHPYGHQRINSLLTLVVAALIFFVALGLIISSGPSLQRGEAVVPSWFTFWVVVLALLLKEGLYFLTRQVARATRNELLLANAVHQRTDSVSSVIVLVGLGAAILGGPGWAIVDGVVALLLAGYLLVEAGKIAWSAVGDLMDAAPEKVLLDDVREHILPTPGAQAYHAFRARRSGGQLWVDLHLQVDPEMTVREGHEVAKAVKEGIVNKHPEVAEVLVHVEPAEPGHLKAEGVFGTKEKGIIGPRKSP